MSNDLQPPPPPVSSPDSPVPSQNVSTSVTSDSLHTGAYATGVLITLILFASVIGYLVLTRGWDQMLVSEPPSAPILDHPTQLENSIALIWVDTSDTETGFSILRSMYGVEWETIAVVPKNTIEYIDTDPVPNAFQQYVVHAVNRLGTSTPSEVQMVLGPISKIPESPILYPPTVNRDSVELLWQDSSVISAGFGVQRRVMEGPWEIIGIVPAGGRSTFVDQAPKPNTYYEYSIVAFNAIGTSTPSEVQKVLGLATKPSTSIPKTKVPSGEKPAFPIIRATDIVGVTMVLRWDDNSYNEDGFTIHKAAGGSGWVKIGEVGPNVTSFVDARPEHNAIINYRIEAFNDFGIGSSGTKVTQGPSGPQPPPTY